MVTLGEKLKLFRNDARISQFDLETALSLGYGSISRMESNQKIPTRSTLEKISTYLGLNDRKFDYLTGSRIKAPSEDEINKVIKLMGPIWDRPDLMLILRDDHFRLCAATAGIKNLLKIDQKTWDEKCYLRNIATVMLDQDLMLSKGFDPAINPNAEKDLTTILVGFYYEMNYLRLEDDYKAAIKELSQNPVAFKILTNLMDTQIYPTFFLISDRELIVEINGKPEPLSFYTEVIPDSTRFSFIHFIPKPRS